MDRARQAAAFAAVALVALAGGKALAHGGHAGAVPGLWSWTFDPWAVVPLALSGGLYAAGLARLWGRAGAFRGARPERVAAFLSGYLAVAVAVISPVDALSDLLFSVHMSQHLLLMLVGAPLLVLGRPQVVFLWAFPRSWRGRIGAAGRGWPGATWRVVTHPLGAGGLYLAVLWVWHVPALYQAAIVSDPVHAVQHATFLFAAVALWTSVLERPWRGQTHAGAVLAVFATAVHSCALGALIALSASVWYPIYAERAVLFGLSPMADQQIGGLSMWVPGGVILAAAAMLVVAGWLRLSERRAARNSALRRAASVLVLLVLGGCQEVDPAVPELVRSYGCGTCHAIPGIAGADGRTGPPLTDMARQAYVAGVLPNTPEAVARFIVNPQAVDPRSAMPRLDVSPQEAAAIARTLYDLGER